MKPLSALLTLSLVPFAAAQEGTPIFVQPPQTQTTPAPVSVPVLTPVQTLPTAVPVTPAPTAPAPAPAAAPARDGVTVWGGFASEVLIIPLVNLNLSVPVAQGPGYGVSARLTGETLFNAANALGVDVLLGRPGGRGVYGGPGAAFILAENLSGWRAGVSTGYRDTFGESRVGYYAEAKLNYLAWKSGTCSASPSPYGGKTYCPSDYWLVSPGLRFGLTYRF